jgi:hypothetical protein
MTDIIQEDGERVNKVVGFCSQEQVVEGKLGLGGRGVLPLLGMVGIAREGYLQGFQTSKVKFDLELTQT